MLTAANKLAGTDYSRFLAVDSIDAETISKAKEIFNRYLSHGIITGGRFEDDEWPVTDEKAGPRYAFPIQTAITKGMRPTGSDAHRSVIRKLSKAMYCSIWVRGRLHHYVNWLITCAG